ncbi:restriction endonuclease subunit S [Proteus terrae]|uniref:restriction endonuclease subunit S n=1 Tax=Proteus terrae TaxID=1574161 RepID=UPI00232CCF49|nr:restriction endonuclease subunit S [Proteus terrae]WCG89545.1 restriction endonuclease subunit S [Proteus terrae]
MEKVLVKKGALAKPLDGNHGGIHPKASDYVDEGIPFIMASDLNNGEVNFKSCKFIEPSLASNLKKGFACEGDILLSHKGTVGRTALVSNLETEFIVLTPQVTYYRVLDKSIINPVYLKVYFDSPFFQSVFNQWAGAGSTRAYLGITAQLKLPIILPPIKIQNFIAEHAQAMNQKIRLNNQINETLEGIAQATFKSWFIDFDPVKAKMAILDVGGDGEQANLAAMRVISSKSQDELESFKEAKPEQYAKLYETAKLFPSEMKDNGLGEVPKGWNLKPLDTIAHYQNGLALQKFRPKENEGSLPVLKIAQLRQGFTEETNDERASENIKSSCIVNDGDVIFSWSATLMVKIWAGGKAALNQHLFKVTSDHFPKWFYYYFTKCHLDRFIAIAESKAVTMGHIKREHLSEAMCATPPSETLQKLGEVISPLLNKAVAVQLQSSTLTELRDTLLPRLLSGEIELPIDEECELDGVANG